MSHSDDIIGELIVKRRMVGGNTRKGHLLSNLIKQHPWLADDTGDRSWGKHPTQNIRWWMDWQVKLLSR